MHVPFVDLPAQEALVAGDVLVAIGEVAREAKFVLGPGVEAFEEWLAQSCGTAHAVGVASGSDALELSLRALGIRAGDAVVTPSLSFVAAAEAIAAVGARPVFCDVEPETMNASEDTVRDALARAERGGIRVRGILPVHLFGRCLPLGPLRALADRENVVLLEDAAQAIGARDGAKRPAGSVGEAGCFSFFPTKNLGAWGDGGAIVTSSRDLAGRLRRLRAHGAIEPYIHSELGRNSRLDGVQAAVLLTKVRHLPAWQAARTEIARRYSVALAPLPLIVPVGPAEPAVHAWHSFVIRCDRRDALSSFLRERGIETRVYYPLPLHRQACFGALHEPALAVTEKICRTALALPMFTAMREDQQEYVIEVIEEFFRS